MLCQVAHIDHTHNAKYIFYICTYTYVYIHTVIYIYVYVYIIHVHIYIEGEGERIICAYIKICIYIYVCTSYKHIYRKTNLLSSLYLTYTKFIRLLFI